MPSRRTNAERTAETRGRLIDAAVDTLYQWGYAATTTIAVADIAKVSRGAMLHHFPTRVDLLFAAAEHILTDQRRLRREKLDVYSPGPERFFAGGDISWDVQKRPGTIALLEIMMASRSDVELAKRLKPLLQQIQDMRQAAAEHLAADLGITDVATMRTLLRVHLACLRGLAIDLMFTQDPEDVEQARKLFLDYEHAFARSLMPRTGGKRRS